MENKIKDISFDVEDFLEIEEEWNNIFPEYVELDDVFDFWNGKSLPDIHITVSVKLGNAFITFDLIVNEIETQEDLRDKVQTKYHEVLEGFDSIVI